MSKEKFYQRDLAEVHDQNYSDLSEKAAEFLLTMLVENDLWSGKVIDLGCGSGKLLARLSREGYATEGVDLSEELLKIGKVRSPKTKFSNISIWEYQMSPCIAVTAIGEIITYRFDNQNSDEHIETLFRHVFDTLVPGGFFLFDYLEPDIIEDGNSETKIVKQEGWTMIIEYKEDKETKLFERDITLFKRMEDGFYRRSRELHKVRLLDTSWIRGVLREIGFEVTELKNYGEIMLRENHVAIMARKRP